jgi:hypothetical protein
MKTLFIATLVGLLVVPFVGNAVKHNKMKSTEWDKIQHHQRVLALATGKRQEARKNWKNINIMIDSMDAHAENATDKLQRDWALRAKANLQKLQTRYRKESELYDKAIKDQRLIICRLYHLDDRTRECENLIGYKPR